MIVIPTAKTGLITAVVLGIARVVGETAPLLLTTSNANNTNLNPFTNPISTIPVYIFQFLGTGYETSVARAWGAALVLLLIVSILFALTRLISRNKREKK
jgi:phosphate transport system permease protein